MGSKVDSLTVKQSGFSNQKHHPVGLSWVRLKITGWNAHIFYYQFHN